MKKKKSFIIGGVTVVVAIIATLILKNQFFASANYSNDYNKTFGEFTANTTSKLIGDENENTCYSPVSLFAALTLMAETTENDTREEILEVLGVSDISKLEEMYDTTLANLVVEYDEESKLTLCNSLWIQENAVNDKFDSVSKTLKDTMECEIYKNVDPIKVNEWVDTNTNHLIDKILDEELNYALALVNTLYYKSAWRDEFSDVGSKEFCLEDGRKVSVDFIKNKKDTMKYSECEDYTVVSVPMDEGEMIFVLPDEDIKLSKLMKEKSLNEILALVTGNDMEEGKVSISIPKYEISYNMSDGLKDTLESLGAKKMFSSDCEWTILDNVPEAYINQKVKFVLDENGIEAAAVTSIGVPLGKDESTIDLEISLDRPFMYILMKEDIPLFIGNVYNPKK